MNNMEKEKKYLNNCVKMIHKNNGFKEKKL